MSGRPSLVFLLDTPNVWRAQALAGTPARVLALAHHAHSAGADVALVLCDRGADLGPGALWPFDVLVVHPADYYEPERAAALVSRFDPETVVLCEAEALLAIGLPLASRAAIRLVYDMHDDDAAVAASLGEPDAVVARRHRTQRAAIMAADHVIVSTRGEAAMLTHYGVEPARSLVLPNGGDTRERTPWGPDPAARRLVFVGNLFYEPNARAVRAIRDIVVPGLRALDVSASVRIVGRGPAELTAPVEGLEFTGRVASLDYALSGVTLAVAPLTAGSGAKMKVVDYLAACLPVLGTREAATGLPADHPGVVVADDLGSWPDVIAGLLADPDRLARMGRAGRRCVESELSWQRVGASLVGAVTAWRTISTRPRIDVLPFDVGSPQWLEEHVRKGALGQPVLTRPGRPIALAAAMSGPTSR